MTPIPCTVGGDLILHNLPARSTERLRYALSYPNQKYHFAKRRGWSTGTEQETIECIVEMPNGDVHIPRGAVRIVKQELMKDGYILKVVQDLRKPGTIIAASSPIALRDYQEAGVIALTKNVQGIVVLPCGGGKTRMAIAALARLALSTLIVVPSLDLADQWCADIQAHLKVTPGRLGGGKKDLDHPVVVAVEDSLVSWIANNADMTWIESFGFLVVDEAHHVPSKSLTYIVRSVPAKYRLGLTATPYREDRADDAIPWNFGSVLLTRTTKELIDAGYLMSAEIDLVATGWSFSYTGPETKRQTRMESALVADLSRNALIADRAVADAQRGESVLILTGRKSHTKELESILQQRGVAAVAVTSETARGKRKRTLADLRSGELHVMIATQLADEGLDIPRLSRVHLAFPQKARGATVQRLGRLLRKYEKWPRLVDYIDEQVPALVKRAQQRRKVYRDTGLLRE